MLRVLTIYLLVFSPLVFSAPHKALSTGSTDALFTAKLLPAKAAIAGEPLLQLVQRKGVGSRHGQRNTRMSAQSGLTLNEAIAIAKARVPGELVSASRKTSGNGQAVYHVKILTRKGVVRTVRVPASSGQ